MNNSLIFEEIINEYNLLEKVDSKGYMYMEIRWIMYGLPQAGKLSNDMLVKRLNRHKHQLIKITPGFWKHSTRPIEFTLVVVEDYCVKYVVKEHADHLVTCLKEDYPVAED